MAAGVGEDRASLFIRLIEKVFRRIDNRLADIKIARVVGAHLFGQHIHTRLAASSSLTGEEIANHGKCALAVEQLVRGNKQNDALDQCARRFIPMRVLCIARNNKRVCNEPGVFDQRRRTGLQD